MKIETDVAVFDFTKAFDKVDHRLLTHKMEHYGIRGRDIGWIKDFLDNGKQRVILDGTVSGSIDVTSSVPKGSVVSLILFIIFINNITEQLHSTAHLFAYDFVLYHPIKSADDCQILQADLKTITEWGVTWKMSSTLPNVLSSTSP